MRELKEQMARVSHDNMLLRQTQDSHLKQIHDLKGKLERKTLELQEKFNDSKKEASPKPQSLQSLEARLAFVENEKAKLLSEKQALQDKIASLLALLPKSSTIK